MVPLLLTMSCSSLNKPCETDEECGWGYFCRSDKRCQEGCRYSIECAKDELCQLNRCVKVQKDNDLDGFFAPLDCDDKDKFVNPAMPEICDNKKDDNCDGFIDEKECVRSVCRQGEVRECYEGPTRTLGHAKAPCQKGKQLCNSKGFWGKCQGQILPSEEICDALDNDCDGQIDENERGNPLTQPCYSGPEEKRGRGICKEGIQKCQKGHWLACQGSVLPQEERCNGKDDDCNGKVDDIASLGTSCRTSGKGICQKGHLICDPLQKKLLCHPSEKPTKELCGDRLDNDCDGLTDEGCPFVAQRRFQLGGFPHEIAIDSDFAAVSLKEASTIVSIDLQLMKLQTQYKTTEKPHGIVAIQGIFYAISRSTLFRLDPIRGELSSFLTKLTPAQNAGLTVIGSRLLSRYLDTTQRKVGLCQTDVTLARQRCVPLDGNFKESSHNISIMGTLGILLTGQKGHFVDFLTMKENGQRAFQLPSDGKYLAFYAAQNWLFVSAENKEELYLVDFSTTPSKITSYPIQDRKAQKKLAGHLLLEGDFLFIALKNADEIAVFDVKKRQIIHHVKVGLGPQGMALQRDPRSGKKYLWVACAGDNSLWAFEIR